MHADKNKPPHHPLISSPYPFLVEIVSNTPKKGIKKDLPNLKTEKKEGKKERKSSRRVVYVRNSQKG